MKKMKTIAAATALLATLTLAAPLSYAAQYDSHFADGYGAEQDNRSKLRSPHGQIFYLADKVVDVNIAEQMKKARYLTVTGQDYGLAKAILDQVIEVNSKVSEAYLLRGLCLTDMKKYIDAENDYRAALMIEPENPTFYYFRGVNYLKRKDEWSARQQFQKALEIEPHYIDVIVAMGDSYEQRGEYKKAIEYYDKVLAAFPNHDVVLAKKQDAKDAIQKAEDKRKEEARQWQLRQRIG